MAQSMCGLPMLSRTSRFQQILTSAIQRNGSWALSWLERAWCHGLQVIQKNRRKIINQQYHTAASFQYIGKKRTLTCVSLPFIAGWLLLLLAKNSAMLLMGRFTTINQCPSVHRMSLKVHHWLLWWNVFIGCPRLLCRDSRDQIPGSTGVPDAGYGVPGNALCQHQLLH